MATFNHRLTSNTSCLFTKVFSDEEYFSRDSSVPFKVNSPEIAYEKLIPGSHRLNFGQKNLPDNSDELLSSALPTCGISDKVLIKS